MRIVVTIEHLDVYDILRDQPDVVARDVRGESLARAMLQTLRGDVQTAIRSVEAPVHVACIEEQPGINVRGACSRGGAGTAHSLKMNNLSYVMLTWLLDSSELLALQHVTFRSTKRKDVLMNMMDDHVHCGKRKQRSADTALEEEERASCAASAARASCAASMPISERAVAAPVAYDGKTHDRNKDISVNTLRNVLRAPEGVAWHLSPALTRSFQRRFSQPAPTSLFMTSADRVDVGAKLARAKADDMCDAVWLATAVALERLALIDRPSQVERAAFERDVVATLGDVRVVGFDVGVRNLACAIVRVSVGTNV